MDTINTTFLLINKLKSINGFDKHIPLTEYAKYSYGVYKEITKLYRDLIAVNIEYPDAFFTQLQCLVPADNYNTTIGLLKDEINSFLNWYTDNEELVDENFSFDAISDAVKDEVNSQFNTRLKEAEDAIQKADEDEKIWHRLARAYGSKTPGGKTEKDLNNDDWNYIRPSLESYEEHFGVKVEDFEKMHEEYTSVMIPRKNATLQCLDDLHVQMNNCYNDLILECEKNVYDSIYCYLLPLSQYFGLINETGILKTNDPVLKPREKKRRYGSYKNLQECIPDEHTFRKVEQAAEDYYEKYTKIDSVFGRTLFRVLKQRGLINPAGCALDHFGDLLISYYKDKCSFKHGRALSDAKDTTDQELLKKLNVLFPVE